MAIHIRKENNFRESLKKIGVGEIGYVRPIFFSYKDEQVRMTMAGKMSYKGKDVILLGKVRKDHFNGRFVVGFLSDLEKSEHEKFTDVTAHLSRVGDNERNTLTKLEHLGEVEDGFLISLAFYDVASTL